MRVLLGQSTAEAVNIVVDIVLERMKSDPKLVLGLATGRTMEPVYAGLVKKIREENFDLINHFFFMLDEYLGLDTNHPSSFKSYIAHNFLKPLEIPESQIAFPPAHLNPAEAGSHYEILIKQASGITLQLLGIGQNGHVGFNEPGSSRNSRTRVVDLSADTVKANRDQFSNPNDIPSKALSMGIATIMESKELLMLATGKSKAETIKYLINHHDDEKCPATFLKSHPHFTLVLDPEAASKISLKI